MVRSTHESGDNLVVLITISSYGLQANKPKLVIN